MGGTEARPCSLRPAAQTGRQKRAPVPLLDLPPQPGLAAPNTLPKTQGWGDSTQPHAGLPPGPGYRCPGPWPCTAVLQEFSCGWWFTAGRP